MRRGVGRQRLFKLHPTSGGGVPQYWVSEPFVNTRIEDVPLWYTPARGRPIRFHLSYRQRGSAEFDSNIFGLGLGWSCSFRALVTSVGGSPEGLRVHRGGAGWLIYTNGVTQYRDGSILTSVTGGYKITHADGSIDTFTEAYTDAATSTTYYFMTSQADPAGNTTTYAYSTASGFEQLVSITDPDGLVTQLNYQDTSYPNQITSVVDPFSRTNTLTYDVNTGMLINIEDVQGLQSSFSYGADSVPWWIQSMTTPYGTTSFNYSGADMFNSTLTAVNQINRSVLLTLPNGGQDLYLFRHDSSFISMTYSSVPVTTPLGNTLDNVDQQNRNSFHWDPLQYTRLSTANPTNFNSSDYLLGRLSHWLTNTAIASSPSDTVSVQREPSQAYGAAGQLVWFDYDGKTSGNNYVGTNRQPAFVAMVLPDGSTRYTHYSRNPYSLQQGHPADLDLYQNRWHLGPAHHQLHLRSQ